MPYCQECGERLDEARFCGRCGQTRERLEVRPGDYLKAGWEVFKQYPGGFVGFSVLGLVAVAILNLITRAMSPFGFFLSSLLAPLWAGPFLVSAKLLQHQNVEFGDFFKGFNHFLPLFLLSLVSSILVGIGFILLIIPGVYLLVSYIFGTLLVLDRRLDFWPAMELSRKAVQENWFGYFAFLLVLAVINVAGLLLIGLGLLVTVPVSIAALSAAYAQVFGWKSTF